MITPQPVKEIKPRYQGTIVCQACHAEYAPGDWWYGVRDSGTRGEFYPTSKVSDDICPFCRASLPDTPS